MHEVRCYFMYFFFLHSYLLVVLYYMNNASEKIEVIDVSLDVSIDIGVTRYKGPESKDLQKKKCEKIYRVPRVKRSHKQSTEQISKRRHQAAAKLPQGISLALASDFTEKFEIEIDSDFDSDDMSTSSIMAACLVPRLLLADINHDNIVSLLKVQATLVQPQNELLIPQGLSSWASKPKRNCKIRAGKPFSKTERHVETVDTSTTSSSGSGAHGTRSSSAVSVLDFTKNLTNSSCKRVTTSYSKIVQGKQKTKKREVFVLPKYSPPPFLVLSFFNCACNSLEDSYIKKPPSKPTFPECKTNTNLANFVHKLFVYESWVSNNRVHLPTSPVEVL